MNTISGTQKGKTTTASLYNLSDFFLSDNLCLGRMTLHIPFLLMLPC